eukprot:782402_1
MATASEEKTENYHAQYSWEIKPKLLKRMLRAEPGQSFESDEFKVGLMDAHIQAFPNGEGTEGEDVGCFRVGILLSPHLDTIEYVTYNARIYCKQIGSSFTKIYSVGVSEDHKQYNSADRIGWDKNCLLLQEIKDENIDQLTLNVEIQILEIDIENIFTKHPIYQFPIPNPQAFKQQHFVWDISKSLLQKMKSIPERLDPQRFESKIHNSMWRLAVVPNGQQCKIMGTLKDEDDPDLSDTEKYNLMSAQRTNSVDIYLVLCALPPNISKITAEWSIYGDTIHRNTERVADFQFTRDYDSCYGRRETEYCKHWIAMKMEQDDEDRLTLNDLKKLDSLKLDVNIEIQSLYDSDGKEVKESDWSKYIEDTHRNGDQKTDTDLEETSGKYSWVVDAELLRKMKDAKPAQQFLSNKFKMAGLEWQITAYPQGKSAADKTWRSTEFDVVVSQLSHLPNCRMLFRARIGCKELETSETKIPEYGSMEWTDRDGFARYAELKQMTLTVEIQILQTYNQTSNETEYYRHQTFYEQPIKTTQLEWHIDETLLQQMKTSPHNKCFESQIFNKMWSLRVIPNHITIVEEDDTDTDEEDDEDDNEEKKQSVPVPDPEGQVIVYLQLHSLPLHVLLVDVKWSAYCDEVSINTDRTAELSTQHLGETNDFYMDAWNEEDDEDGEKKILKPLLLFDDFKKQDSFSIDVNVGITQMTHRNGDKIKKSDWSKYVLNKPGQIPIKTENTVQESEQIGKDATSIDTTDNLNERVSQNVERMNEMSAQIKKLEQMIVALNNKEDKRNRDMIDMQSKVSKLLGDELKEEMKDTEKVRLWLKDEVKLPQYFDLLINDGYDDLEMIADITVDELVKMGVDKSGHRKKIIKYAQKLGYKADVEGQNVIDTSK